MRFFLMGTCFVAPLVRFWFLVLERAVPVQTRCGPVLKMVLDQGMYAPCYYVMFISSVGVQQGLGKDDIKEKLREEYVNIMKANYTVWPAVQILNFTLVPFQHRLLTVNIVGLFWRTFLASRTNLELSNRRSTHHDKAGVVQLDMKGET